MVQLQETVLGKAVPKSASLMKDMDELTKQARGLLAEIALPSFVCTHDHSQHLAMERYYYNKGRTIVDASEENLMQLISTLQRCKTRVERGRTCVSSAELELDRATLLLTANQFRVWTLWSEKLGLGSQEDVDAAQSALERYRAEFQKAQSTLKKTEEEKIQAEVVQACLMCTLPKHLAMDQYFYSKDGKINCRSETHLVTGKNSALQQYQEQVEKARTDFRSAKIDLKDNTKMMVKLTAIGAVYGGIFGLIVYPAMMIKLVAYGKAYERIVWLIGYLGRSSLVLGMGSTSAAIIILDHQQEVDKYRSELGKCKKLYQTAQDSLKIQQKVDTEVDDNTCTFLKDHGWYYCNEEGTRQRNAAEVNRAIVAKRSALQQCQERVELARIRVISAENKLMDNEQIRVRVGAVIGVLGLALIGGPVTAVFMASTVATVATGIKSYIVGRSRSTLERCKKDYLRFQNSLRETEHDFDTMQVELGTFTHLKRPKHRLNVCPFPELVSVEWRYYYRHRQMVLTDVKVNKPEIEVKMNTRLQYYFSKFRNFF